jgi:hypothetical protein
MTNSDEFLVAQPPDYTQKLDCRMTLSQEDEKMLSSSLSLHNDDDHYEEGHDHTTRDWAMDEAVDDDGIISQPATQPPLTQQIITQQPLLGFCTNNGSGTAILSVSDEQLLTKAENILRTTTTDQSQHSIGGTTDDKLWRTKDNDYDENDDSLKEASHSTFTLGFVTGRSRTAISISDEQLAKAQMILGTKNNPLLDDDDDDNNNEQDNNHKNIMYASNGSNTSVIETAHNTSSSSMVGFCTGGSRKAIEITKEQLHKAGKILEATTTMMQHPRQQDSSTLNNTEYDNISNDDRLIMHNNRLNDHNTKSSIMPGFCTGGSGKSISVSDEQIASAIKLLDTMDQHDTDSQWGAGDDDNDDEEEGDIITQPVTQLMTQPCDLAGVRRHGAEIENERYHQQMAIILPSARAMTGSGDDVTDMMEIDHTTNSSLQRADVGRGHDTNTLVNTAGNIATPNHGTNIVTNAVTNPYARNSCMESLLKRPFDEISGEIRNQVYNPYHKSNQTSSKRIVGNPYSKSSTSRSDIVNLTAASMTINNSHQERPPPTVAPAQAAVNLSSVRRTGVSISLPMVERLPSRNVSYRPAEILTVSELYHYLYECWEDAEDDKGPSKRTASSKELISVRITGMLLCVANSITDEKDGVRANLYNSGMYLLVGDPLDNTRLVRKDNTANRDLGQTTVGSKMNNVTNITVSKTGLTSILRNKSAPTLQSSTDTTRVPGVTPATAIKYHEPTKKGPAAKPENESDNTDISNRKPASRGILNTTKKKKLVYNGGGSRLSFGGLGVGKGIGGLGGRKFTTPKRASSSVVPVNNLMKKTSSSLHAKRGLFTSIHSTNKKNLNPIQIIQRHPSSLVPVWIGSSYDDDGLDGSVVGDLVMIMGEIVTELCINCHQRDTSAPNDGSENSDVQQEETNAEGDSNKTLRIPLIPVAQLRGVTDAANLLASTAMKISGKSLKCGCRRFLQARLIKNANGTDMILQRESLRVRRAYMAERKRLMEALTTV